MKTIICEDCGKLRETAQSNTRFCRVCRLLKNLTWLKSRTAKCLVCECRFAPLERNAYLCPKCDPAERKDPPVGNCALCDTEGELVDTDVHVCMGCATSIDKRPIFHAALIKKVKAQKEANNR